MSTAAVVVSFNRKDLLNNCLAALQAQDLTLDEIIVVDNGSTDGSAEMVRHLFPTVSLVETRENLGGAGGFAWGVELAIARCHDYAWLMDDDGEPETGAHSALGRVIDTADFPIGFVASMVTRGGIELNPGNVPVVSTDPVKQVEAQRLGAVAVDSATFVGVLVNLAAARQTHLPLTDFFIWVDDTEYTRRLSRVLPGLMVPESRIKHPLNRGDAKDIGPRLFYFIRNNLWVLRESQYTKPYKVTRVLEIIAHTVLQGIHAADKRAWATSVARGYSGAVFTRPRHVQPGSMIAELSEVTRDAATTRGMSVALK